MVKCISQIAVLSLAEKKLKKIIFSSIFSSIAYSLAVSSVHTSTTEAFCISLAVFYTHSAKVVNVKRWTCPTCLSVAPQLSVLGPELCAGFYSESGLLFKLTVTVIR